MFVYCLFDRVAGVYSNIFTAVNDAVATRSFSTSMKEHPYAQDYELYRVARMDVNTGDFFVDKRTFIVAYNAIQSPDEVTSHE